jgi:multiple sugar transport system permease protein
MGPKSHGKKSTGWKQIYSSSTIFVLPAALLVLVVIAYPFVTAIWISFTNKTVAGPPPNFIGLRNYWTCVQRSDFWQTFFNTMIFASGTLILSLLLGLALGLALNQVKKARDFIGAIILLPWIVPTVISTLVWLWMFNPFAGVLNYIFTASGLSEQPISWLGLPRLAMISVIVVSSWRNIPYFGVITLAGIKQIPHQLFEASQIDGANAFQRFVYVTVPALKGVLFVYSTLVFVQTAYDFALIYILTRGGPVGSTEVLSVKSFMTAFETGQMGLGAAVPLFAFPLFAPWVMIVTRRMITQWAGGAV